MIREVLSDKVTFEQRPNYSRRQSGEGARGGTVFQVEGTHIQRLWGKSMDGTAKRSGWNIYKQGEEEVEDGAIEVMKWSQIM